MTITEKVAYLKGLADGLGVDKESKEGKLLAAVIDVLEDMALDVEDLGEAFDDMGEALDQVSDDLDDVESIVYDDEDDDDDEDEEWDEDDDEEEPVFYEVTCPACGNTVTIDEDVLELGGIDCPNCGERLEFIGLEDDEEAGEDEEAGDGKDKPED